MDFWQNFTTYFGAPAFSMIKNGDFKIKNAPKIEDNVKKEDKWKIEDDIKMKDYTQKLDWWVFCNIVTGWRSDFCVLGPFFIHQQSRSQNRDDL